MMCFGLKERKRTKTNHCVIVLLDDTQLVHELHASSTGQDLLDVVIKHLNLLETSYFGLRYFELSSSSAALIGHNQRREPQQQAAAGQHQHQLEQVWLDMNKSAIKQLKGVHPMTVYFGVKYYASDPCKLAEEITRYQFFLQCKQDILHSRLPISLELAVELFALAVQSELGDYDPARHQEGYVGEFHFLANQSFELEKRVALFHRTLIGQVPATAELNFLERVKWLDLYGCELHPIQYEDNGEEYALGLNPSGVLVLRNRLKVAHYHWQRIVKTKCQGRCFLMDVIGAQGGSQSKQLANANKAPAGERNRFGFRLPDKEASRRLRWSIEEHKSFQHLINSSAALNQQLAQRQQHQQQLIHQQQQQQLKLGERFRNSIRSAINLGPFGANLQQQQQLSHEQKMRSSMKSLQNSRLIEQQFALDSRPQPTVVRMPSRRYGNRLPLANQQPFSAHAANGNGLPSVAQSAPGQPTLIGGAHTMVDSQRQQALMLMGQLNQMNGYFGKSQTLRPMTSNHANKAAAEAKEAKKYYQAMMAMMTGAQVPAEVAILPAGRHIVQPSIYKSSSVVNGLNQLGESHKHRPGMQFFNTRPQYLPPSSGYESPRSTKSAIAPSNALKLACKKLAKQQQQQQQQQMLYANQADIQPLLAGTGATNYELSGHRRRQHLKQQQQQEAEYCAYNTSSANPSPRSARSARMATAAARHKSKSTNENLHLLHQQSYQNGKALLVAATNMGHQLAPPSYHDGRPINGAMLSSDNPEAHQSGKVSKRREANLLASTGGKASVRQSARPSDSQVDDYCCSRSDCSSIEASGEQNGRLQSKSWARQRQVMALNANQPIGGQRALNQSIDNQHDQWNAIRRRHNQFSSGKGFLLNNLDSPTGNHQQVSKVRQLSGGHNLLEENQQQQQQQGGDDVNNNNSSNTNGSQLIKNISSKQATPILLSMNYDNNLGANNKAVQLLNLQRQQLNSQSAFSEGVCTKSSSLAPSDSAPSSVASSPKAPGGQSQQQHQMAKANGKTTADSTASSSTTSGYYAGTNSTGSASVDSDSQMADLNHGQTKTGLGRQVNYAPTSPSAANNFDDWHEEGTRAKIALGSYASRMVAGNRLVHGATTDGKTSNCSNNQKPNQQQQQFYLSEANDNGSDCQNNNNNTTNNNNNNNNNNQTHPQHWSPLNQIQQHPPSSLKYVSFDV